MSFVRAYGLRTVFVASSRGPSHTPLAEQGTIHGGAETSTRRIWGAHVLLAGHGYMYAGSLYN